MNNLKNFLARYILKVLSFKCKHNFSIYPSCDITLPADYVTTEYVFIPGCVKMYRLQKTLIIKMLTWNSFDNLPFSRHKFFFKVRSLLNDMFTNLTMA